jgi:hypothetical protein
MNSITAAAVHPSIIQAASSNAFTSTIITPATRSVLQTNNTDEEVLTWRDLPEDHPCWIYYKTKEDDSKKEVWMPVPPPPFDISKQYLDLASGTRSHWSKCHLLSLPKDIRLKIYEYVLTDPSNSYLPVGIDRKPFSPCYKLARPPIPELSFFHAERHSSVSLELLRTNRTVYEEALPVLYKSARFMPSDLEGLFPLFLQTLSPFARSCIRNIYLCIPRAGDVFRYDRSKPFFHWAVTCAQVAKLNGTVEQVEISGEWSIFESIVNRKAILFPLCKIKAEKLFRPCSRGDNDPQDYDTAFQELLIEAEQALKTAAKLREVRTKAEAIERCKRNAEQEKQERETEKERTKKYSNEWVLGRCRFNSRSRFKVPLEEASSSANPLPIREPMDNSMKEWSRWAEENITRMEKDLSRVPGIKQFEKELEEHTRNEETNCTAVGNDQDPEDWDLVSMASGTSTPKGRPGSVFSKYSDETWPDTASTLIGKDDIDKVKADKRYESDTENEDWDYVER